MIAQFFIAAAATLAFSILFQTPSRHYIICGLIGGASWAVYLLVNSWGSSALTASFVATIVLMLMARLMSVLKKTPSSMFLTAGIFPLVPGTGIYYTAYYLFAGDLTTASEKGAETFLIAGAISLGILFGSAIPQGLFVRCAAGILKLAKLVKK